MTRSAGNRFRTRKLSTKQSLAILRENQIDSVDDDAQRHIPQIETGVERQEEIEHHLQAAISAHQAAAVGSKESKKVFIPTPNTTELSAEQYAKLYPKKFQQPFSYIRSSATVEDCCGTSYCMSEEDDKYLAELNAAQAKANLPTITEDEFESLIELYENQIKEMQPYLTLDVNNIIGYDELAASFIADMNDNVRSVSRPIYDYWRGHKIVRTGKSIIPCLKFEQGNEKDEGDPYVCFRRREVRQVRKTRRTDAQSTDKLKKLRQDIETARGLVNDVRQREVMRKNSYKFDMQIFEQRRIVIDLKRKHGIKDSDEDLVNKPKRRQAEPAAPPTLRIPIRQDGKPPDADLRHLSTLRAEEEKRRLEKYNQLRKLRPLSKYPLLDVTHDTLGMHMPSATVTTPPPTKYCNVQTFYLPSPPNSAESLPSSPIEESPSENSPQVSIVQASPSKTSQDVPSFRRRVGRGGRILIDRRGRSTPTTPMDIDPVMADRMKYDHDDEDSEAQHHEIMVDPSSALQIKFRARLNTPPPDNHSITLRRQVMAGSPVLIAPGAGSPNAQMRLPNGHPPPGMTQHVIMTPNGVPGVAYPRPPLGPPGR
ncbi:enhancer of polycomb-like-domain-containing protein [Pyronema domesticum]|nr:enhancer of polycomb-like-domain-containing protein [Pyronema domesticum]